MGYQAFQRFITSPAAGSGEGSPPASGATITLHDTGGNGGSSELGWRYKCAIVFVYSSHASGANGLSFQESHDDGANWHEIVSYTVSAATATKRFVSVSARRWRVRYANSANTLTTFVAVVAGDTEERAGIP